MSEVVLATGTRDTALGRGGKAPAKTPGALGWSLLALSGAAAGLGLVQNPYDSTWAQALQKFIWMVAVAYGIWRYRPRHWQPWACMCGYFALTWVRNMVRFNIALNEGGWRFDTGTWVEMSCNIASSVLWIAASVMVMRGRRPKGEWWALADAWVIGIALLLIGLRLATVPIFLDEGFSGAFLNIGVHVVLRAIFVLVPVLAVMMSERVSVPSLQLYFYGVLVYVLFEYMMMAGLRLTDAYNSTRTVAMVGMCVGEALIAIAALVPSMRNIISARHTPSPPWNLWRTVGMCVAVVLPIIAIALSGPLDSPYRELTVLSIGALLLALVNRLRFAVQAASRSQADIQHLAHHDELSGLPNRRYLNTELHAIIARDLWRVRDAALACCYIDLDNLKDVNDHYGHQAGDRMIQAVAFALQRLSGAWRRVAVRVGGDEFVVLAWMAEPGSALRTGEAARELAATVAVAISGATTGREDFATAASVGVAWMRCDPRSNPLHAELDQLLVWADLAQVHAKQGGGGQVVEYSEQMSVQSHRRVHVHRELPQAWQHGQMSLAYQPVVRLEDDRVCGAEALLRWRHPQLGMVPPPECIRAAERQGIICELGRTILEAAIRDVAGLGEGSGMRVGVNLSGHQLQPAAIDHLTACIAASGMGDRLWLEITEQELVQGREYAAQALVALRRLGVKVAIDDFGTGFCGLDYLCTLPVDIIKFDGIFAREAPRSATHRRVLQHGVELAHSIGAVALAEGVEDMRVARLMRELGCEYAQGYGFGRPVAGLRKAIFAGPPHDGGGTGASPFHSVPSPLPGLG